MFAALANPHRFLAFSRWAAPILGVVATVLILVGLWQGRSEEHTLNSSHSS